MSPGHDFVGLGPICKHHGVKVGSLITHSLSDVMFPLTAQFGVDCCTTPKVGVAAASGSKYRIEVLG